MRHAKLVPLWTVTLTVPHRSGVSVRRTMMRGNEVDCRAYYVANEGALRLLSADGKCMSQKGGIGD